MITEADFWLERLGKKKRKGEGGATHVVCMLQQKSAQSASKRRPQSTGVVSHTVWSAGDNYITEEFPEPTLPTHTFVSHTPDRLDLECKTL